MIENFIIFSKNLISVFSILLKGIPNLITSYLISRKYISIFYFLKDNLLLALLSWFRPYNNLTFFCNFLFFLVDNFFILINIIWLVERVRILNKWWFEAFEWMIERCRHYWNRWFIIIHYDVEQIVLVSQSSFIYFIFNSNFFFF